MNASFGAKARFRRLQCFAACVVLALSASASAHETWLQPSTHAAAGGKSVRFDLTSGMDFPKQEFAVERDRVANAAFRSAGSTGTLGASKRGAKALTWNHAFAKPGLATVWVDLKPKGITLTPDKVEEYFAEINASAKVRATWKALPMGTQWNEMYTKHAKTYVRVGDEASDESWKVPAGMSLEIMPLSDPTRVSVGDTLRVSLLRSGFPLPRTSVGLMIEGDAKRTFAATDETGVASFPITRAGAALIYAVDLRPGSRRSSWESDFATLTFEAAK
jgi:uncharacterized GH25 family protein